MLALISSVSLQSIRKVLAYSLVSFDN